MAYQTYITEALVCGSFDSQTADRSFLLFTREAGMIYAHAKSIREERSKQRYALQLCSHIRVTLVRGKNGWKIIGAVSLQNLYTAMKTREARAFLRNIILLLKRVIHGESAYTEIFDDVIIACTSADIYESQCLEPIISLRILHALGYVAPHETFMSFLHVPCTEALPVSLAPEVSIYAKQTIEHALIQSQL